MAGTSQASRHLSTNGVDLEGDGSAVLIPVKTFDRAKARLAGALSSGDRARLARLSATKVLIAARPLDTFVICDDHNVRAWAIEHGAEVITPPQPGLNNAVEFGFTQLRRLGYSTAIIAHGDLPSATDLAWVADFPGLSIVTDRHGRGTNVMAVPTATDFDFHYGDGSGNSHRLEGLGRGLSVRWIRDSALSHDIDTPTDLELLSDDLRAELVGRLEPTSSPINKGATT